METPIRRPVEKVEGGLGSLIFGGDATAEPLRSAVAESNVNLFNPFAPSTSSNPFAPSSNPFLASSNPFAPAVNPFAPSAPAPAPASLSANAALLAESMSSLSIATPSTSKLSPAVVEALALHWPKTHQQPAYSAQYLTTSYEPLTPASKKIPLPSLPNSLTGSSSRLVPTEDDGLDDPHYREGKSSGGRTKKGGANHKPTIKGGSSSGGGGEVGGWCSEGYEVQKVSGVDEVFLRFLERVGREGQQVVRLVSLFVPLCTSSYLFGPLRTSSTHPVRYDTWDPAK